MDKHEEKNIHAMMRDPRYWRDKDPEAIKEVTGWFKEEYPDKPTPPTKGQDDA